MIGKIRILPAFIIFATILFGVRVSDIWMGLSRPLDIAAAHAETAPAKGAPTEATAVEEEGQADSHGTSDGHEATATGQGGEDSSIDDGALNFSKGELELLQNLAHRRAELDAYAKNLDVRDKVIEVTERRVDEKLTEIKQIEASIKAEMEKFDAAQLSKVTRLVKVYESMKAKDAARIFDSLSMDVLIPVAERMNERKIAVILGKMAPDNAKDLTEKLGARKKLSLPSK